MYKCLTLHDPIIICPYDKNHFIAKSRLQKHIVKCEKVSKLIIKKNIMNAFFFLLILTNKFNFFTK